VAWRKTHAVVHLPFGAGGNQESGGLIIIALPRDSAHLALHPALSSNGLGWDNEEKHQIISISRSIAGKAVVAPRHDKQPPTQERSISAKSPGYISACNGSVIVRHDQHVGGFDV
jgi:hypothetical protein